MQPTYDFSPVKDSACGLESSIIRAAIAKKAGILIPDTKLKDQILGITVFLKSPFPQELSTTPWYQQFQNGNAPETGITKGKQIIKQVVKHYIDHFELEEADFSLTGGTIQLRGKYGQIERAVNTSIYRAHLNAILVQGIIHDYAIPAPLTSYVEEIGGLNLSPGTSTLTSIAQKRKKKDSNDNSFNCSKCPKELYKGEKPLTSGDIAELYRFPKSDPLTPKNPKPPVYAILLLGGDWKSIQPCIDCYNQITGQSPVDVEIVNQPNRMRQPESTEASSNLEGAGDLEMASSILPNVRMKLVYCDNSLSGILWALNHLVYGSNNHPIAPEDIPSVISTSWVFTEESVSCDIGVRLNHAITRITEAFNITMVAASGDFGSTFYNPEHPPKVFKLAVGYPASHPNVLAAGGSYLNILPASGDLSYAESIWNGPEAPGSSLFAASGGGPSSLFDVPSYQEVVVSEYLNANYPAMGAPTNRWTSDLAIAVDTNLGAPLIVSNLLGPETKYAVGTSGASVMLACLVMRLVLITNRKLGLINQLFYRQEFIENGAFNLIPNPGNCLKKAKVEPKIRDRWIGTQPPDSTTLTWYPGIGLGSPNGDRILDILKSILSAS